MSADANLNALWCRAIAEELVRGGTAHAVLCPGSRNSPLLFALATAFGDQAISHIHPNKNMFRLCMTGSVVQRFLRDSIAGYFKLVR